VIRFTNINRRLYTKQQTNMAVATTTTTTAAAAATATTTSANQRRNIVQSDVNDDNDCCGSCPVQSTSSLSSSSSRAPSTTSTSDRTTNTTVNSLRIVTWSNGPAEVTLRAYAELYRTMYPTAPIIQIYTIPSLKQLDMEVTNDLKTQSRLYDGFVIPPILLGNMIEQDNGLVPWEDKEDEMDHSETTTNTTRTTTTTNSPLHDLLPYYKYSVATFGGPDTVLAVPLFGGSQQLVLYRKDYFDRLDMSVTPPKTWSDYVRIASELHDTPLGPGGSKIYGSCLGRLSFEKCRQQQQQQVGDWTSASATATATTTSTPLSWCNSQSMDYIGMMLSSMTQSDGNFTGWMMGVNSTSPSGLQPLFLPPIERILVLMEQQIKYGAPNELLEDATMNLRLFEQGLCGMTITSDHSMELLSQDNVGFGPLPGSHQVLDRSTTTTKNNNGSFIGCTESVCPYGVQYDEWGTVNMVPFGNTDIPMGAVSAFVSQARQDATKRFFHFVMASSSSSIDASVNNNDTISTPTRTRGQPMTYSELNQTTIRGYKELLTSITSSENGASSFRIPNALNLYTELDNTVYDYLVSGNYTEFRRTKVASTVETTWQYMIQMHDSQGQSANPTSVFYEQSLGRYVPENITPPPPSDGNLYIGDVARIIGWSLGGLSCLASVLLALWVWKYQNETVVRGTLGRKRKSDDDDSCSVFYCGLHPLFSFFSFPINESSLIQ
jgi:ABC-type glycerol-3-phosphate transport system substrate-binding protein